MRSPTVTRMQPYLLSEDPRTARKGKKLGEVVGGTAAECTAVWCCCPCSVVELLVLGLYKVPTSLFKKAWRRRKRRRLIKNNTGLLAPTKSGPTKAELEAELDRMVGKDVREGDNKDDRCARAVDLDQEMWDRFYGTGFWRSRSQRDT